MDQIPHERIILYIQGIVQGVGFRPFVVRAAKAHGITGWVRNAAGQVEIDATGTPHALSALIEAIRTEHPPGSYISALQQFSAPLPQGDTLPQTFSILESGHAADAPVMPSPDLSICEDCLRELFTESDPRHLNPFISCTHCGPRYSIMARIPYDRGHTSMAAFPLCPLCQAQYTDIDDRRYHAQTVCCNECGPTLRYHDASGDRSGSGALHGAVAALKHGGIIAVKGIGGYHLACSPFDQEAVGQLRILKGREAKPFAVMFERLDQLAAHCEVSRTEQALLESPAKPIVLLRRRPSSGISPLVYADSLDLGAFLPYTPLQHLLLREAGPLIMTSANVSSLPIIHEDAAALQFFEAHTALAGVLSHDRPILRRLDDSVAVVTLGAPHLIRRARGYVPLALPLAAEGPALLAFGAQQKNTVCFFHRGQAFLSAEAGDLDSLEAEAAYRHTIAEMGALLDIKPALAVCDMHPDYAATRIAKVSALPLLAVQHHHAHIASVMAEHRLNTPVIGVAFDGTGYGPDGTVWGGEFLLVSPEGYTRAGHLKPVAMLGSDDSVRQGWKSAACMLHDAGIPPAAGNPQQALVAAALAHGVNTIRSSSMGRLFDAVSAMLGICQVSAYDGQGAIALENAAARHTCCDVPPLPFDIVETDGRLVADFAPCIRALHQLAQDGDDPAALAWRFHVTVSTLIETVCLRLAAKHNIRTVALSGGVFHNRLLLAQATNCLQAAGLAVYTNEKTPPGDGCIALGQARVALWQAGE